MCIICAVKAIMKVEPGKELKREPIGKIDPTLVVALDRAKTELQVLQQNSSMDAWLFREKGMTEQQIKQALTDAYEIRYEEATESVKKAQDAILKAVGIKPDAWEKDNVQFEINKADLNVYKSYYVDIVEAQS